MSWTTFFWNVPNGRHFWDVIDENDKTICELYDEKRAKLIAAAPELLEACEDVLNETAVVDDNGKYATVQISSGVLESVRAAIKKARGQ